MEKLRRTSLIHYTLSCLLLLMLTVLTSTHAQFDEVSSLLKERRYQDAANKLADIVNETKDIETLSRCYNQLGEIYYNYTQQYPEALKAYEKILGMKSDGLPLAEIFLAYIKISDVYSRMGDHSKAIHSLRTLISMAPEGHFVHKIGSQKIRDIRNALKDIMFQKEIIRTYKNTPLDAVAQFQIAELYRTHSQLNQPDRAIEAYQQLLNRHPNNKLAAEAQWRIAHIRHTVLHQVPLAIEAYRKVINNYPTSNFAAEALFHIAGLHREDNKYQNALSVYNAIVKGYPNFWNMHAVVYWSGICHENLQNYSEARNAFQIFMNVYLPTLDPVYLGQIAMYDKSIDQVTILIQNKINTLTQLIPKQEYEKLEKAVVEEAYDLALTIGHNLILIAPETQYAKRASAQLISIQHRSAIQKLHGQIQSGGLIDAEKARTQLEIASIYERKLLDYSNAVDAYRTVVRDHPVSSYTAEARYRIGIIYSDILAKPSTAIQTFNSVIEHHPNTLQAMMANFQIGEIYRKLQRYSEALQAYKTTIGYPERELYLPGGYKDSFADRAQFRIGRVHYEDQRYNDARFAFEEFIKNRKGSPRLAAAYIYLAAMHQVSGEKDTAADYYQKAENILKNSQIQIQMVIDEAGDLGYQSSETIIQVLQDRQKRLGSE